MARTNPNDSYVQGAVGNLPKIHNHDIVRMVLGSNLSPPMSVKKTIERLFLEISQQNLRVCYQRNFCQAFY